MKHNQNSDLAPRRRVRNDILLVAAVLLLAAAAFLIFRFTGTQGDRVVVLIGGEQTASYPLSEELETVIRTGEESNTLVIRDGKALVTAATCPDGICVDHHPISKSGETIVCLPHQVVIKVEAAKNEVDIVT